MGKKKTTYRLYVMPFDDKQLEIAQGERFSRATALPTPYILVYSCGKKPERAVEITEGEKHRLSTKDWLWLMGCQSQILAEAVGEKKAEEAKKISETIKTLEEEIEKTRKKEESDE